VAAGVLLITGWLALIACAVAALVLNGIVGWVAALVIAAVLSFAGSGMFAYLVLGRAHHLLFRSTRRQLSNKPMAMENPNAKPG
ncbi:MAG: hypothetical protein V4637_08905, partial [Pseudomonadota bacterium]